LLCSYNCGLVGYDTNDRLNNPSYKEPISKRSSFFISLFSPSVSHTQSFFICFSFSPLEPAVLLPFCFLPRSISIRSQSASQPTASYMRVTVVSYLHTSFRGFDDVPRHITPNADIVYEREISRVALDWISK
jgi:hypothetical protein